MKIVICNTIIHLLVKNFLKSLWPRARARVCESERERAKQRTVKF